MSNELADRLEALMRPDSYIWGNLERAKRFTEILMALRAEPTTRLPDNFQGTVSVHLHGFGDGLTIAGSPCETTEGAFRSALDALAAQLAGKEKQPLPDHGMAHEQE